MCVKTAVLVSGGGTNLQALIDASRAGKLPHVALSLVLSNRADAYALTRAREAGIPSAVCERAKGEPREAFEAPYFPGNLCKIIPTGFSTCIPR